MKSYLSGTTRDKVSFIMLTSPPTQIPIDLMQQALKFAQILFPVPDEWLRFFDKWTVHAIFKDEDTDYLYSTLKLATYSGRHLDAKRNQIKQLLGHHVVKIETLDRQFNDAQQILDEWQIGHQDNLTQTDYYSCQEAIHNLQLLHLQGLIVYVDRKPAGFIIGEKLNNDSCVVHFSKALHSC